MNVDDLRPPELQYRVSGCPRHPDETGAGVCPSCLRERLARFDPETRRKKPPVVSGLKNGVFRGGDRQILPELRRSKSFSARGQCSSSLAGHCEPKRRSCDVRAGRNTLWSLFHIDDENAAAAAAAVAVAVAGMGREVWGEIEIERSGNPLPAVGTVFESREEGEDGELERVSAARNDEEHEIRVAEQGDRVVEGELRTMKAHIELEKQLPEREPSVAGSFWLASIVTRKIQKWRRKRKDKKREAMTVASETADIARPSCDTEPRFSMDIGRFSLDAGRHSIDMPRFSWDEPRASWDGYLIGKVFSRQPVVETVCRIDNQIPVVHEDVADTPGGSLQTRDYYSDSSSSQRRRKSTSSNQQVPGEENGNNCNDAPGRFPSANSGEFPANSHFCDYPIRETFSGGFAENGGDSSRYIKKSRKWNIWGLIHRRGGKDDERVSRRNGIVDRSFSESWKDIHGIKGHNGVLKKRDLRCNSSMSSRSSKSWNSHGDYRNNSGEVQAKNGQLKPNSQKKKKKKKKREEPVLDRSRSARFSPVHPDNGLLRFYLTPLTGSRRCQGNGKGKNAHSFPWRH